MEAVAETTSDMEAVQAELDAVTEALSKLEAMCIAKAEPYEERQVRLLKRKRRYLVMTELSTRFQEIQSQRIFESLLVSAPLC
eukprot:595811-Amphidinium_carterae.2